VGSGGEAPDGPARAWLALAGAVAAALALSSTELFAGALPDTPSLVDSVASVVIDASPIGLVRAAIELLGTRDKPVLVAGVVVLSLLCGAGLALAARRRRWVAPLGLVAFAALGVWAAGRPQGVVLWRPGIAALAGVATGAVALRVLRLRARPWTSPACRRSSCPPGTSTGWTWPPRRRWSTRRAGGCASTAWSSGPSS
jgi:hypothetical protein